MPLERSKFFSGLHTPQPYSIKICNRNDLSIGRECQALYRMLEIQINHITVAGAPKVMPFKTAQIFLILLLAFIQQLPNTPYIGCLPGLIGQIHTRIVKQLAIIVALLFSESLLF